MERLTSLNAAKAYFDEKIENGISELSAVNSKTKTPRILSEKIKNISLVFVKKRLVQNTLILRGYYDGGSKYKIK